MTALKSLVEESPVCGAVGIARVLSALSESGGSRKGLASALARLALSAVGERA